MLGCFPQHRLFFAQHHLFTAARLAIPLADQELNSPAFSCSDRKQVKRQLVELDYNTPLSKPQPWTIPSLSIERIEGYPGLWSGRISRKYRWTFHFEEDSETGERICVHRVIGVHEDVTRKP